MSFARVLLPCAVALGCAVPTVARAESAAVLCDTSERVLPRVTQLPANAPGIVVLPPLVLSARDGGDFVFKLKSPGGEQEPITVTQDGTGSFLLSPAARFNEGHYTVEYENVCQYWSGTGATKESKVNVGPAVSLPLDIATTATAAFQASNHCYPMQGSILVTLDLTAEMHAYREVSHYSATFRGARVVVPYGDHGVATSGKLSFVFPLASCTADQPNVEGEFSVTAHVAGATVDPNTFRRRLVAACPYFGSEPGKIRTCDPIASDPPDAQTPVDVGVTTNPSTPDAGAVGLPNALDAGPAVRGADSGCSYGGRGGHWGWAAMVLALLVSRRRSQA